MRIPIFRVPVSVAPEAFFGLRVWILESDIVPRMVRSGFQARAGERTEGLSPRRECGRGGGRSASCSLVSGPFANQTLHCGLPVYM